METSRHPRVSLIRSLFRASHWLLAINIVTLNISHWRASNSFLCKLFLCDLFNWVFLFIFPRDDDDIMESVLASQDTQQDSDDSGFGTVLRGSTLSTVTHYVYIKFLRLVMANATDGVGMGSKPNLRIEMPVILHTFLQVYLVLVFQLSWVFNASQ